LGRRLSFLQGHYFDTYVNSPQFPEPWPAPQMTGINPLEFQKAKQARLRQRGQQAAASTAGDTCHRESHLHAVFIAVQTGHNVAATCHVEHKQVFCHAQPDVLTVWLQVLHATAANSISKDATVCDCGNSNSSELQCAHVTVASCRAWH